MNVGKRLTLATTLNIYHYLTKWQHRDCVDKFLVDVRKETWFVPATCKYIDFRLEKNREAVLYSVIPTFGDWTDEINVRNVLHLCNMNSAIFFLVCVRTICALTDMHPICVVYDIVRRYTVPNHKVQESFFRLYRDRPLYDTICEYLDWLGGSKME